MGNGSDVVCGDIPAADLTIRRSGREDFLQYPARGFFSNFVVDALHPDHETFLTRCFQPTQRAVTFWPDGGVQAFPHQKLAAFFSVSFT